MWNPVQKFLNSENVDIANDRTPALGGPRLRAESALDRLAVGQAIRFSARCPLAPLTNATAYVLAMRHYRFGTDVLKNFQLQIGRGKHYFLTIAEDEQGQYLSLSRALSEHEQDHWFGRDALGFFMEPSTAKTIRCKADLAVDGDWAGERYSKTVDWIEGSITQAGGTRGARHFHYNLLVTESGEKALEIEHDDLSGENRVFVTVYRPVEDIARIEEVAGPPESEASAPPPAPVHHAPTLVSPAPEEPPLFREPLAPAANPKQRPDFRRADAAQTEIRISRTEFTAGFGEEETSALPSFLVSRDDPYLSLDEVIAPEPERLRVGLKTARALIDRALARNVRVRDVLRELLGLESALSEEVIFELPLTDDDYRTLATRYKLRPDHRSDIRQRLEEELKRILAR